MDPEGAGVAGGHRAAVSDESETVGAVWRIESAHIVGALARYTGDFALAEELAQEALAEALVTWPRDGVPRDPAGWLMTVGRRAIDAFRRCAALDERYAALAHDLDEGGTTAGARPVSPDPTAVGDLLWDPDRVGDDVLALVFVACHPLLSPEARVALTLRVIGGLTSDEIARTFLAPTPPCRPGSPGPRRPCRPHRSGSRCRRARSVGSGWARCSAWSTSSSPVDGDGGRRPDPARPPHTRRFGWRGSSPAWCPTSPRSAASSRCSS